MSGIDCVLEDVSGKRTPHSTVHTYEIQRGQVLYKGEGDFGHGQTDNNAGLSSTITEGLGICPGRSNEFRLTLYPTGAFYRGYHTRNPIFATIAAVAIVLLTSLLFLLYDFAVRRNIHERDTVLQAKRNFLRFVSHEVRTPLNVSLTLPPCSFPTHTWSEIGYRRCPWA